MKRFKYKITSVYSIKDCKGTIHDEEIKECLIYPSMKNVLDYLIFLLKDDFIDIHKFYIKKIESE